MSVEPDRIAWLVSRFPVVTETFILREMDEIERWGATIELFSLVRDNPEVLHDSARARLGGLTAGSELGVRSLAAAQLHWLRRRPRRLASAWIGALWGNRRSPSFLLRALAIVPVAAAFARTMVELDVRRVHAHWATHPALAAWVVNRLTDLPYGVTAHAHDIQVDPSMLAEKLEAADLVVTISDHNRRHLIDTVPEIATRCSVVRCGVPRSTIELEPPSVRADAPDAGLAEPFHLCCVASLKPYKGHRHLLAAIALLGDRGHRVDCAFAGAGDEADALAAEARRLGVDDRVRFLGALDGPGVASLLAASDAFVLPSITEPSGKTEGIPVALMEAMASGLPVVTSRLSGIPELVEDGVTGLLVEPGDRSALADAIETLLLDPAAAAALSAAARRRVDDEFTVEDNAARLADLLDLTGPRPPVHIPADAGDHARS